MSCSRRPSRRELRRRIRAQSQDCVTCAVQYGGYCGHGIHLEPQSGDTATPATTVAAATDKTRTSAAAAIISETLKSCSNLLHSEAQLSATTAALDPVNISEDLTVQVPTAAGQAVRKGKPFQLKPACK